MPQSYTFSQDRCSMVNGIPFHGLQFYNTNVGEAEESRVYINPKLRRFDTTSISAENMNLGNVVRVTYSRRVVDTPYRISFVRTSPKKQSVHNDHRYNQKFLYWLEPINAGVNHIIAAGRTQYSTSTGGHYNRYHWTRKTNEIEDRNELLEMLESDDRYELHQAEEIGESARNFQKFRAVSDPTIAEAFNISDPNLMAHVI